MSNCSDLTRSILAASLYRGVGKKGIIKFLHNNTTDVASRSVQCNFLISDSDWSKLLSQAEKILDLCCESNITPVLYATKEYPGPLCLLEDAPHILYVKGNIKALHQQSIAVIGTRDPNDFSRKAANELGYFFATNNFCIVSGLALGCDTQGHMGALRAKGHTIAVLAHGVDSVYPAKNRQLATEILNADGALVSEYPPGTKPYKNFFVQRDRLQSGLSQATILVQSKIGGGSMHTANFCLKQRRILAVCAPQPPEDKMLFSGNMQLISDGKATILRTQENLQALAELAALKYERSCSESHQPISSQSISHTVNTASVQLKLL